MKKIFVSALFLSLLHVTNGQNKSGVIYTISQNGSLLWFRDTGYINNPGNWVSGAGGDRIGYGWTNFSNVISGDSGVLYAVLHNGNLCWYRDTGYLDNPGKWMNEGQRIEIGEGWDKNYPMAYAGKGVIYAVNNKGNLLWYRDTGYLRKPGKWLNGGEGLEVGNGWKNYYYVLSAGNGVLYAVDKKGNLFWYKDEGWLSKPGKWANNGEGKLIGNGWNQYTRIFSGGNGIIYAVDKKGNLMWYKDEGWLTNPGQWANNGQGTIVDRNWNYWMVF